MYMRTVVNVHIMIDRAIGSGVVWGKFRVWQKIKTDNIYSVCFLCKELFVQYNFNI